MFIRADTLDDLLRYALERILAEGVRVEASRGWNTELTGVLLKLTNPRARLSHTETRGKVFSPLGELAWYLAASNDVEFISYYISEYRKEAEADGTIRGA
jgi:thymidylate synthase